MFNLDPAALQLDLNTHNVPLAVQLHRRAGNAGHRRRSASERSGRHQQRGAGGEAEREQQCAEHGLGKLWPPCELWVSSRVQEVGSRPAG